jgi:hypothetical protein
MAFIHASIPIDARRMKLGFWVEIVGFLVTINRRNRTDINPLYSILNCLEQANFTCSSFKLQKWKIWEWLILGSREKANVRERVKVFASTNFWLYVRLHVEI